MASPLKPEIRALFEGPNLAHVATVMADGSPQVVPVWIGIEDDDRLTFVKEKSGLASANIRRDPRVAVSITSTEDPYEAAYIRGRVVGTRGDDWACVALHKSSMEYTGAAYPEETIEAFGTLVGYVVEVDRAGYWLSDTLEHTPPGDHVHLRRRREAPTG